MRGLLSKLRQISEKLSSMNLSIFILTVILAGLVVALFVGIDKLMEMAESLKNGSGGFAEGMILTAIVGVITTLLSSITLIVKGIVDSLTSRKPEDK